ncbi:tetratricopeptide repeat protein [Motiliproteus sp.]|uniref:tetratricopeptide repeat protein n=1 Tax=Motiliproteus sp. TaxID=1898955 RepID=UPI003BAB4C7E
MLNRIKPAVVSLLLAGATVTALANETLYQSALEYQRQGDERAAVIELKNLLSENPEHAQGRLLLGELYLKRGDLQGADKELRRARQLNAESPRLPLLQARVQLLQGQAEAVQQHLLTLVFEQPELEAERLLLLGHSYQAMRQLAQAEATYQAAEALLPSGEINLSLARLALLQRQPDEAIRRSRAELSNPESTDSAYSAQLLLGQIQLQLGDPAGARKWFEALLVEQPKHLAAQLGQTRALLQQRELELARRQVDELLSLAPGLPDAQQISAALYLQAGELEKARDILDPLSQRFDRHPEVGYLTGYTHLQLGNLSQAENLLSRNLTRHPQHRATRLALVRYYIAQQRFDQAQSALAPLLDDDQIPPQVYSLAGALSLQRGDTEAATGYFRQAMQAGDERRAGRPLAISEILSGELDAGISRLEGIVAQGGKADLQTDSLLVRAYLKADNPDKARQLLQQRIETDQNRASYQLLAAILEIQLSNFPAADQLLNQLHREQPEHLGALLGLAQLARFQQQPDKALDYYRQAQALAPADPRPTKGLIELALQRQQPEQAIELADDFYQRQRSQEAAKLYLALLNRLQRQDRIAELLPSIRTRFPNEPAFALIAIKQQVADGKLDSARVQLEQLVDNQPDYLPAQLRLLQLLLTLEQPEAVLARSDRFIDRLRRDSLTLMYRGDALRLLRRPDEATQHYRQAYDSRPSPLLAARLSRAIALKDRERAVAFLDHHLQRFPRDQAGMLFQAELLQRGKPGDAVSAYERLLTLNPDHIVALNNLAWVYQQIGDSRALETAERAYQLAPNQPAIGDTLGWILLEQQPQKALPLLEQAAAALPNPTVQYHYAAALAKTGQREKAIALLESLMQYQFDDKAEATELLKSLKS